MPEMKGDEFLIKVHERFPNIIKVMITGHTSIEGKENAERNANLFKCIFKPWSEEELIETIKSGFEHIERINE